jgi:hypothetical protein
VLGVTGEAERMTLVQACGFTLQIGLVGWVVLALLERFTRRARAIWSTLAVIVLALSFAPIWLVGATTGTRAALVVLHIAVAAVLVPLMPSRSLDTRPSAAGTS